MSKFIKRFLAMLFLLVVTITIKHTDVYAQLPQKQTLKAKNTVLVDIKKVRTSENAKNLMKKNEGVELHSYPTNDGHSYIGYGHLLTPADSILARRTITLEEANIIFEGDVKRAEQGVRSSFKDISGMVLTQGMFDTMVSLTFNMGLGGFRKSDFIKKFIKKDYIGAAEKIKESGEKTKYPSVKLRRTYEYNLFIMDSAELFIKRDVMLATRDSIIIQKANLRPPFVFNLNEFSQSQSLRIPSRLK